MQNSYLQWKQFKILGFSWKMQKNRKMISFGNFCSFFEVFTETLEQNIRKSHKKMFFRWKRRQIKKNEQFSNFWEYQLYRKAIAFGKIGSNYVLSANSTKNMLIRVFLHTEFISAMKKVQNPRIFVKNAKKIEKWLVLVISINFLRFSLKLLSRISEKVRKYVF